MDKRTNRILTVLHVLVDISIISFPISYMVTKKPADSSLWLVTAILLSIDIALYFLRQDTKNKTK